VGKNAERLRELQGKRPVLAAALAIPIKQESAYSSLVPLPSEERFPS